MGYLIPSVLYTFHFPPNPKEIPQARMIVYKLELLKFTPPCTCYCCVTTAMTEDFLICPYWHSCSRSDFPCCAVSHLKPKLVIPKMTALVFLSLEDRETWSSLFQMFPFLFSFPCPVILLLSIFSFTTSKYFDIIRQALKNGVIHSWILATMCRLDTEWNVHHWQ